MRLKCVKNKTKDGFFSDGKRYEGITVGKIYEAAPVSLGGGGNWSISLSDVKFLIYNDLNKWEVYPKSFFAPRGKDEN